MSTVFIKKDNVVLVGVAKNGSTAIKEYAKQNKGFEIREQQGHWNEDSFIDFYDRNLLILFPIRDFKERALSEFLENCAGLDTRIQNRHKETVGANYTRAKYVKLGGLESYVNDVMENGFIPRLNYFNNSVMEEFFEKILFNENWNGCKIRFFDLIKLSTHIPKYLGWDNEISLTNMASTSHLKRYVEKLFINAGQSINDTIILPITEPKIRYRWGPSYHQNHIMFLDVIRRSKYWINL